MRFPGRPALAAAVAMFPHPAALAAPAPAIIRANPGTLAELPAGTVEFRALPLGAIFAYSTACDRNVWRKLDATRGELAAGRPVDGRSIVEPHPCGVVYPVE